MPSCHALAQADYHSWASPAAAEWLPGGSPVWAAPTGRSGAGTNSAHQSHDAVDQSSPTPVLPPRGTTGRLEFLWPDVRPTLGLLWR